jgi:ribose 5-phosphate isomerase A
MTIVERALELVPDGSQIGLGSGRAAQAFVKALGERVRTGSLRVQGVPTSEATAHLARQEGIPLVTLADVETLELTVDGADEVDSNLDLIKGYGRALVREKIVAASSRRLIILAGDEKLVPQLGTRGKLPVEVIPFALPLCVQRLHELDCFPAPCVQDGRLFVTDNGNHIIDCGITPLGDALQLERDLCAIPGVVGTGLFLGMAETVLVGDRNDFGLIEERNRPAPARTAAERHRNAAMSLQDASCMGPAELANTIKRRIVSRTVGQIQSLEVGVTGDQVPIKGSASCYYYKQLALQVVLDTNGAMGARRIEFDIDVVVGPAKRGAQ